MSRAPMPDTVKGDAPMPSSFDDNPEFWEESRTNKLVRRLKEEPLVPIGLAATCYALFGATRSIRRGDKRQTNQYFRARVYAQAFTLLCVCVGSVYWKEDREKRKQYEGLLGEKRAQEKKEAWIRELEARDEEDRAEREQKQRRREKRREVQQKKEGEAQEGVQVQKSVLEGGDLRRIVGGDSSLVGSAMSLWRWRHPRDGSDDDADAD